MEIREQLSIGEHPYTFARVSAMKAKLLKKSDYDKLLKMKENEIARYLQDFEYKDQINKLGVQYAGTELIEMALKHNAEDTLNKLKNISEGDLRTVITEYLKKEDNWNIKTIIRGKFTKTPNDEIRKLLIPVGEFDANALNKFLSEDDIEKILKTAKLEKYEEIRTALKSFKERKELEIIEAALDKVYYRKLASFINELGQETTLIKSFLSSELDTINIKIILKFKREKIGDEIIRKFMFTQKNSKIPKQKWEKIIAARTFEQTAKEFEGTPYEEIVKEGLEELSRKQTLSQLDLALQRYLLRIASTKTHQNPLSPEVIISYMLAKEIEIRNINLIVKSKQLGLNEEFIQKELII